MVDPVLEYGAQVMPVGYRVAGDVRSGLKATVPYFVTWAAAFNFAAAIISPIYTTKVGIITFRMPYRFPAISTPMYAQRFDIEPCGSDGRTAGPGRGLNPGEFFTNAVVTVEYETLPWIFDPAADDPNGLNQLDPNNPITLCEQSVKIGGRQVTRNGSNYVYAGTTTPINKPVSVLLPEAKLVLNFPMVPFLPWQLLVPYVGCVNSAAMLGCAAQTLLLESPSTEAKPALNAPTSIQQSVTLEFAYNPLGHNMLPRADGTLAAVTLAGDGTRGIYPTADFREIFQSLSFSQIG